MRNCLNNMALRHKMQQPIASSRLDAQAQRHRWDYTRCVSGGTKCTDLQTTRALFVIPPKSVRCIVPLTSVHPFLISHRQTARQIHWTSNDSSH